MTGRAFVLQTLDSVWCARSLILSKPCPQGAHRWAKPLLVGGAILQTSFWLCYGQLAQRIPFCRVPYIVEGSLVWEGTETQPALKVRCWSLRRRVGP